MMTIPDFQKYVAGLPRAAHDMEHITNFGKIVAGGFVLLSATIDRASQRVSRSISEGLGGRPVDNDAARAKRAAERAAKERQLREQLAAIQSEAQADDLDADLASEPVTTI